MERNERRIIGGNWNNAFSVSSGDEAFESSWWNEASGLVD